MALSLSSLDGLGGEGKRKGGVCSGRSGGRWGFLSFLALGRGVRRELLAGFSRLPWCESGKFASVAIPLFNKRWCHFCCGGQDRLRLLSTCPGGEGKEEAGGATASKAKWRSRSQEHATSAADPERWRLAATAISGQRVGPAVLDLDLGLSSFFLLNWRIFSDSGVAVSGATPPSGLVLGGGSDGRVCESTIVGVCSGLDRVFARFCGVLFVKAEDHGLFVSLLGSFL